MMINTWFGAIFFRLLAFNCRCRWVILPILGQPPSGRHSPTDFRVLKRFDDLYLICDPIHATNLFFWGAFQSKLLANSGKPKRQA